MTPLAGWENFYVIVGSSAGALIGLQFVVITLIADLPIREGGAQASSAFGTPTIVHFGAALLLAAILSMPWHGAAGAAVLWGLLGLAGIAYETIVTRRMRLQSLYQPVFEDWVFHVLLPFSAYAILAGSAYAARFRVHEALFVVAAAALLLLFVGIHNAWDAVTYHVYVTRGRKGDEQPHS
jgi:D-alanyl-lipoteichoic acid acyltransferase DltB (MBOAT superfamily)